MCEVKETIEALAEAIPDELDAKVALTAIGVLVTGIICHTEHQADRNELVELFCDNLRRGVTLALH